jgi:riboflavin kinase/FMN adenylyltransferase
MQVYQSLSEFLPVANAVVTVGTFDGVHFGHRKILAMLREKALANQGEVVLLTFHPHPRKVLFPDQPAPRLLNSIREKTQLLSALGVDHLIIQPFTTAFSKLEYDAFVRDILVAQLRVESLVIGYDHQFGRDRKGNISSLQLLARQHGFKVIEIPEQDIDHAAVSSTRIRRALISGRVAEAAELLGYRYELSGTVIHGQELGRKIGYPTANLLPLDADKLVPAIGVYAVTVEFDEKEYGGMLNIGTRPTFDDGEISIEVNIFDFDGDLYGRNINLHFVERIRDEQKFDSVQDLIHRIAQDKVDSLRILDSQK